MCVCTLATQLCPTLCNPMDCSLPGTSVSGIFQARILEWIAIPFSRGSFQSRDQTQVSYIAGRFFTFWATWETLKYLNITKWAMNGISKRHYSIIVTKILTVTSFHMYNENQNNTYTTLPLHFQYIKTRLKYKETNTR